LKRRRNIGVGIEIVIAVVVNVELAFMWSVTNSASMYHRLLVIYGVMATSVMVIELLCVVQGPLRVVYEIII
jgi:hypothetical protein